MAEGDANDTSRRRRPNRTAAQRRQQQKRQDTRLMLKLVAGICNIDSHRGNQLSKVGQALQSILVKDREKPENERKRWMPVCIHHERGVCTFGDHCRFRHVTGRQASTDVSTNIQQQGDHPQQDKESYADSIPWNPAAACFVPMEEENIWEDPGEKCTIDDYTPSVEMPTYSDDGDDTVCTRTQMHDSAHPWTGADSSHTITSEPQHKVAQDESGERSNMTKMDDLAHSCMGADPSHTITSVRLDAVEQNEHEHNDNKDDHGEDSELAIGDTVEIHGLKSRTDLIGVTATVEGIHRDRWMVRLDNGAGKKLFKQANLKKHTSEEHRGSEAGRSKNKALEPT